VQDNLPIYVFSIDTPSKGSQSLSNEVQNHSGVIFAQRCHWHRCASLCSRVRFPFKKHFVELFAKIFEKNCLHNGVNDTAVQPSLSIIFANSKPYSKVSVTQGELFDEKNRGTLTILQEFQLRSCEENYWLIYFSNITRSGCFLNVFILMNMKTGTQLRKSDKAYQTGSGYNQVNNAMMHSGIRSRIRL
jgi:hypothetical protein